MFKTILLALGLAVSVSANANTLTTLMTDLNKVVVNNQETQSGFSWAVGDTANYKLSIGGFINGTMVMTIKSVAADAVVIGQDMDLGFMGKQSCDMTINPNTGETKSMVCNGQAQDPNAGGPVEVIETKEDTVTVPAGTFTCLYIKAKQGENQIEQWANPKLIPVAGMVKAIAASQMGPVNIELTSFKKM